MLCASVMYDQQRLGVAVKELVSEETTSELVLRNKLKISL